MDASTRAAISSGTPVGRGATASPGRSSASASSGGVDATTASISYASPAVNPPITAPVAVASS
ncbi:hypothetical protein [Clavibacter michiganensis]|uniref:hypothetical protein n=1 Tax=Clavibacter michiganensis TaxID=28447 RepID=UPI001D0B6696|nr:hypothetical protein [Clavibacter michiganensis]UDM19680.1 hypothetical protein LHJ47_11370 [Clavibacter michiganensis subsp. michiganensis]